MKSFIALLTFWLTVTAAVAATGFPAGVTTTTLTATNGITTITGTSSLGGVLNVTGTLTGNLPAATTISGTIPSSQVSGSAVFPNSSSTVTSAYAAAIESMAVRQFYGAPLLISSSGAPMSYFLLGSSSKNNIHTFNCNAGGASGALVYRWGYGTDTAMNPWSFAAPAVFSVPFSCDSGAPINSTFALMVGGTDGVYPPTSAAGKFLSIALINTGTCEIRISGTAASQIVSTGTFSPALSASSYGIMTLVWDGSSIAKAYVSTGLNSRQTLVASATSTTLSGTMSTNSVQIGWWVTGSSAPARRVNFESPRLYFSGTN